MKPMPGLDGLLARAAKLGMFGTKMRSVINHASKDGIAAIARRQFEIGGADGGPTGWCQFWGRECRSRRPTRRRPK